MLLETVAPFANDFREAVPAPRPGQLRRPCSPWLATCCATTPDGSADRSNGVIACCSSTSSRTRIRCSTRSCCCWPSPTDDDGRRCIPPLASQPGRLFVVGDAKQSIYRFRGADYEAYRAAIDRIVETGGVTLDLTGNFRSVPGIVAPVNCLFADPGGSWAGGGGVRFGRFLDRRGRRLDHGYRVLFAEGRSYTGEPTAELWSHGSPAVLTELVAVAVQAGAAPAEPGEFTYRALRNGRMDLARAEAVRDLIDARTRYQARLAFTQAEGALSKRLAPIRERLEEWIARAEAAVEFVDESETHLPGGALAAAIDEARAGERRILAGYGRGRIVREGARLVLVGRPNVGKSSLFNRLLAEDRAIVTAVEGTTRDTLEETLDIGGVPVRLIDTAGLRPVDDPVEVEGVRRTERARQEADLILLVLDASRTPTVEENEALERAVSADEREQTVVVRNKIDLLDEPRSVVREGESAVSATEGHGMEELREVLRQRLLGAPDQEDPILTQARHAEAIGASIAALDRAAGAIEAGFSEELVLEDLREAIRLLGEITGEYTTEDLYDRIFSTFCIGK